MFVTYEKVQLFIFAKYLCANLHMLFYLIIIKKNKSAPKCAGSILRKRTQIKSFSIENDCSMIQYCFGQN